MCGGYGVPNYSLLADERDEPKNKPESEENEMIYNTLNEIPSWGRSTIKELIELGCIAGEGNGELNLSYNLVRALFIMKKYIDAKEK